MNEIIVTFKKIIVLIAVVSLFVTVLANYMIFQNHKRTAKELMETNGKTIIVKIQAEFNKLDNTLKLLEDLYEAQDQEFLDNFHSICNKMLDDDRAIGSLYFAPDGVIQYSVPLEVEMSTNAFKMLEDPIQGPKAREAIDSGITTIAGPHVLIEGGRWIDFKKTGFCRWFFLLAWS